MASELRVLCIRVITQNINGKTDGFDTNFLAWLIYPFWQTRVAAMQCMLVRLTSGSNGNKSISWQELLGMRVPGTWIRGWCHMVLASVKSCLMCQIQSIEIDGKQLKRLFSVSQSSLSIFVPDEKKQEK